MKKIAFGFICVLLLSSCVFAFDDGPIQEQIDEIRDTRIGDINHQIDGIKSSVSSLEAAQASLSKYVESLQEAVNDLKTSGSGTAVASLESGLSDLQKKSAVLQEKIETLQSYVDSGISSARTWASATFATLDQYVSLQSEVSAIKRDLANINTPDMPVSEDVSKVIAAAKSELMGAIADTETSMKSWVNSKLTAYYTIAETEARLTAIKEASEDCDSTLKERISSLERELSEAVANARSACEKAISEAITNNNGVVDTKISNAIASARTGLDERIGILESRLSSIELAIAAMKNDINALLQSVQSVVVVPSFNDGSVRMVKGATDVSFEILPLEVARLLAASGVQVFSFDAVYTRTKAPSLVHLPVSEVSFDGGFVTVSVDGTLLGDDFFNRKTTASGRLKISAGHIETGTGFFSLEPVKMSDGTGSGENESVEYEIWD